MKVQTVLLDSPAPSKVRGIARERGATQADLASMLGLSRMAIVRRFSGEVTFSDRELVTLSHALQCPVGAFFGEAPIPPLEYSGQRSALAAEEAGS